MWTWYFSDPRWEVTRWTNPAGRPLEGFSPESPVRVFPQMRWGRHGAEALCCFVCVPHPPPSQDVCVCVCVCVYVCVYVCVCMCVCVCV